MSLGNGFCAAGQTGVGSRRTHGSAEQNVSEDGFVDGSGIVASVCLRVFLVAGSDHRGKDANALLPFRYFAA